MPTEPEIRLRRWNQRRQARQLSVIGAAVLFTVTYATLADLPKALALEIAATLVIVSGLPLIAIALVLSLAGSDADDEMDEDDLREGRLEPKLTEARDDAMVRHES